MINRIIKKRLAKNIISNISNEEVPKDMGELKNLMNKLKEEAELVKKEMEEVKKEMEGLKNKKFV